MAVYQRLTERVLASGVTTDDLIHIVITGDTTQDPDGSSYKAKISQVFDSISGYCFSNLYVSNIHSCSPLNINPLDEGNVYFGSTSGITLDILNKRIGVNTSTPQYILDTRGVQSRLYYDSESIGGILNLSGNTNIPRFGVQISPYLTNPAAGGSLGVRAWDDVTYQYYGNNGDMFLYAGNEINSLNIINGPGTLTDDSIKFYAGIYPNLNTAQMTILGAGTTKGYVGIGTETPSSRLHVSGNTKIDGGLVTNTVSATTYYNLPYFTGNTSATCITNIYTSNVNSCSPLHIQPVNSGDVYISENGGTVGIGTTTVDIIAPETLTLSAKSTTSYNIITAKSNVNNYTQLNIINKSYGVNASADVVATNNTGNESTNFIDMGINGSNFSGNIGIGNDAYLYSTGRELYVGNANTGTTGNVRFFAGNNGSSTQIFISGLTGYVGIGTTTPTQKLHVSGNTKIDGGLTANTISATTYLNLPTTTNGYLPLSGGTVTGGTVFTSGVTANTISQTSYIDFTTGSTNPSAFAGRLFFDSGEKALSYFDIINNTVPIAMGQQLYTRVWNNSGIQIDKGKVIAITGTSNNLPSAILATNNHELGSARPIGVAAENIPNGSEGLVINNGILSGITVNTFSNGDTLYLSDTIPGGYVSSTSSLAFSARTNEIGYVIQTGTTTGKIYVNINNEDSNLTLTDIERNILEGNVISSGAYEYTGMTQGTGSTINVAPMRGWIVKNTYSFATLPDVVNLYYPGGTNIPLTNLSTSDSTFILVNSASTLVQQTTFPTPQERRENIFLGKVVHPTRTAIQSINQTVDFDVSPMAAIRDLWTPLKLINQGILVSPNGVNMNINTSAGTLWGNGIGWTTNQQNPDSISISGTSPTTFQYRTRLGVVTGGTITSGNTTTILPGYYDLNGVVTAVGGGSNSSTNQRVFLFPTGIVRIQLGQQVYSNLAAAVAGSQTEQFVEYSLNRENGILIGIISLHKGASVGNGGLVNTSYAVFNFVSKFGELLGGTGGLSTTTLQQAYDNSVTPEIVTELALGALSIKNGAGTADNVTNVFEGLNAAGTVTSFIRADGTISATTLSALSKFLPPVMTQAQRLAISLPEIGLIVYQTDATEGLYVNKSGGWTFIV